MAPLGQDYALFKLVTQFRGHHAYFFAFFGFLPAFLGFKRRPSAFSRTSTKLMLPSVRPIFSYLWEKQNDRTYTFDKMVIKPFKEYEINVLAPTFLDFSNVPELRESNEGKRGQKGTNLRLTLVRLVKPCPSRQVILTTGWQALQEVRNERLWPPSRIMICLHFFPSSQGLMKKGESTQYTLLT